MEAHHKSIVTLSFSLTCSNDLTIFILWPNGPNLKIVAEASGRVLFKRAVEDRWSGEHLVGKKGSVKDGLDSDRGRNRESWSRC